VVKKEWVGTCSNCGAKLYYNIQEDRLEKKGGDPDCPCYFGENEKEEESGKA